MSPMASMRAQRGLLARIARGLGVTRGAVSAWPRVPAERVPAVSRITGIPPHELRPDLYEPPSGASDTSAPSVAA